MGTMGGVIPQISRALLVQDADGWTDARLLECFLATHDETAFEVLVRRHGSMVLGVCHRILRNPQDAEDAFQATFLVLVRKADSIVPRGMVGNWLYGVAYQTALKARAMADKRGARERQVMDTPEPAVAETDEALWRELRPIIDEELSRLPAKYRAPLVLCDIEEKTYKEAAEQLGWPEGTVAGRLSRARAMLAARLARRGVVLPAVALAALLTHNAASAAVPGALVVPTVKAAALAATGQATAGAVSANVLALTEGVVRAMMLTQLKIATVVLLGACLVVSGMGFGFSPATAEGQEKKVAQPPAQPQPKDKKVDPKVVPPVVPGVPKNDNDEKNGQNNQNGNDEKNGNNNQNGNDEKNGNNNQNGNDEKNGQNNQNGNDEQGVVKAINQDANTVTVVVNQKGKPVEKVFALPKDVPVTVAGKAAKLGDLKVGMKVGVTLDKDKKGVVGIKQMNEPNGQNNNGNNGNGQNGNGQK